MSNATTTRAAMTSMTGREDRTIQGVQVYRLPILGQMYHVGHQSYLCAATKEDRAPVCIACRELEAEGLIEWFSGRMDRVGGYVATIAGQRVAGTRAPLTRVPS